MSAHPPTGAARGLVQRSDHVGRRGRTAHVAKLMMDTTVGRKSFGTGIPAQARGPSGCPAIEEHVPGQSRKVRSCSTRSNQRVELMLVISLAWVVQLSIR